MLTQERVRELFDYDEGTGGLIWRVGRRCGKLAGCIDSYGYSRIVIGDSIYRGHMLVWLHFYGYIPEHNIDHVNRIRCDNRLCNLREVGQQCNIRNTGNFSHNTSGVKGVSWDKVRNKWSSSVKVSGKKRSLGRYEHFINAVAARLAAEQHLDWGGCDCSSPAYKFMEEYLNGKKI